ncbi:hypothetical protein TSMEX_004550 [Taenia solium]|eukprot:TsM_000378100 transcript=TsM_000378100 gene=TsM_000378100
MRRKWETTEEEEEEAKLPTCWWCEVVVRSPGEPGSSTPVIHSPVSLSPASTHSSLSLDAISFKCCEWMVTDSSR